MIAYMKSLHDSELFKIMDDNNKYTDLIKTLKTPVNLDNNSVDLLKLSEFLDRVKRRFSFNLKNLILKELSNNNLILINESLSNNMTVPNAIPTVVVGMDNGIKSLCFVTNHIKETKEGEYNVTSPLEFYGIMEIGTINRQLTFSNIENNLTSNIEILELISKSMSKLMVKILDKLFAVRMDSSLSAMLYFLTAKYYLMNVMGINNENSEVDLIAVRSNPYADIDNDQLIKTAEYISEEKFYSLTNFLNSLSEINELKNLNLSKFAENWMKLYGESSILSLEYFPFTLHMIFSSLMYGYKSKIIKNEIEVEGHTLYKNVTNLILRGA